MIAESRLRLASGAANAAAVGALTLVDPSELSGARSWWYRGAVAGLTGWATFNSLGSTMEYGYASRVAWSVASAGLAFGVCQPAEALDARLQQRLRSAGLSHPRVVVAGAVTALMLAGSAVEFQAEGSRGHSGPAPQSAELDDPWRGVILAMLSHTQDFSAPALRTQLRSTINTHYYPEHGDLRLMFDDEDVERVWPRDFWFPVQGRFTDASGAPWLLRLQVSGGLLATLELEIDWRGIEARGDGEWHFTTAGRSDQESPRPALPPLDDITFALED